MGDAHERGVLVSSDDHVDADEPDMRRVIFLFDDTRFKAARLPCPQRVIETVVRDARFGSFGDPQVFALLDDTHFKIATLSEHGDVDVEWMLLEQQIHLTERQFDIQQPEVRKHWREYCAIHAQSTMVGVD